MKLITNYNIMRGHSEMRNTVMKNDNNEVFNRHQILTAFNDHFIEFFEYVEGLFPDNTSVSSAKNAILSFRKMNPRIIMIVFYNSINKMYRDQIASGNLNYFAQKDYTNEVNSLSNADTLIQKINSLREPVSNMSKTEQQHVIKYLNNLITLSDMYH